MNFNPEKEELRHGSEFDRWRPALLAFAVLVTVIAFGIFSKTEDQLPTDSKPSEVVTETTLLTHATVPLSRSLKLGMQGDDVLRLQQRLKDLRFDPGPVDGEFGQNTMQAVWAFEKLAMGVPRDRATGVVDDSTWSIMQSDIKFNARRIADSATHVEIYLPEQVLIVFNNGAPVLISHISSGTSEQWCEVVKIDPGEARNDTPEQIEVGICGQAITPPGIFYFYNRRSGMRETALGSLYNPVYFNYNIAIHGAILVPLKPSSHGCVRVPMSVARYFPALVKYGDRVYVFDGIKDPEQYGSPVPPFDKPDPNFTTIASTTTVLPTTTIVGQPTPSLPLTNTTISTTIAP